MVIITRAVEDGDAIEEKFPSQTGEYCAVLFALLCDVECNREGTLFISIILVTNMHIGCGAFFPPKVTEQVTNQVHMRWFLLGFLTDNLVGHTTAHAYPPSFFLTLQTNIIRIYLYVYMCESVFIYRGEQFTLKYKLNNLNRR